MFVTNFLSKVAQIFDDLWGYFKKMLPFQYKQLKLFWQRWERIGNFESQQLFALMLFKFYAVRLLIFIARLIHEGNIPFIAAYDVNLL